MCRYEWGIRFLLSVWLGEAEKYYYLYLDDIIYHKDDLNLAIFRSDTGKKDHLWKFPSLKVCRSTPTYVDKILEFIVDTSHLLHWKDVISSLVRCCTKAISLSGDEDDLEKVKGTF